MRTCERIYKKWLLAAIIVIALLYVFTAVSYDPLPSSDNGSISSNSTTKKILFWNTMFGDETFYFGKGDVFRNCPSAGRNCWATHDRLHVNVEDFDAVLFHGNELRFLDLPSKRREHQNYVFVNLESPLNRQILDSRFDKNFFNLTMTYGLDSDCVWSYGHVRKLLDGSVVAPSLQTVWETRPAEASDLKNTNSRAISTWDESEMIKTRRKKTKTAVWFVSNCQSQSGRDKYANELAMHVDVDIFGLCGKEVRCPKEGNCFRKVIEPDYYFYLSFENSMCQDYVTEKLYTALMYDVVPIVYGGANYSLFAPPRSYINALDFDSPRQLAIYLKRLIAHPSEYDKYFEWKKTYKVVTSNRLVICQLCQYLQENNSRQSYSTVLALHTCPLQEKLKNVAYLTRKDLKN